MRHPFQACGKQCGFTLVELLVVIGIIAVLVGILLPVLSRTREQGNTIKCRAQLSQIGLALRQYTNDNRDHLPNPEACGDAPNVEAAAPFRRGIDEPDPTNPSVVETLGLHNLLYRLKYLPNKEVWVCPSAGGRTESLAEKNSYTWNITRTISGYTSVQRGRTPRNAAGNPAPGSWWLVQDNAGTSAWATNAPKTTNATGVFSNYWYYPHQYAVKRLTTSNVSGRQGSTNVLFYDGHVGVLVFSQKGGTAAQAVIRDP